MSSVLGNPVRIGVNTWEFEWTGTAPYTIYNYESAKIIKSNYADTTITLYGASDLTPPPIQVFDSTEAVSAQGLDYPPSPIIQWRGHPQAYKYIIRDENEDQVSEILETGLGYYSFSGIPKVDGTTVEYTVNIVDINGNEAPSYHQTFTIICNPPAVAIQLSYDSGTGDITVAEAV
jgi:hypothetical protein